MKKFTFLLIFFLMIQQNSFAIISNQQRLQELSFKEFIDKFITSFNDKKTEEINNCLHPEFGLFVLDNPGASYIAEHFKSFDEVMNIDSDNGIGYLKKIRVECKFTKGEIPVYNCDNDMPEGWSKEGCYYDLNKTHFISEIYKNMLKYNLGDKSIIKTEIGIAKKSEKYITHLAYSTAGSIGFYFGIIDNRWYLICIDKIQPCSA